MVLPKPYHFKFTQVLFYILDKFFLESFSKNMGFATYNELLKRFQKADFYCNNKIPVQFLFIVWIFCSRQTSNMVNKLLQRTLRIILNDHIKYFEVLLQKSNDKSSRNRNIRTLVIELYKLKIRFNTKYEKYRC